MTITNVLVTGANAGIGKECCRQLALLDGIQKVYMGCRNVDKAKAAKTELESETGKPDGVLEIIILDVSDPESIEKAVSQMECSLDGLVLNAGGIGVDPLSKEGNKFGDGVTNIFALNVLGHAHLVNLLMEENKLNTGGTVIWSGSESSRGVKSFQSPAPELKTGSIEEFISICDGSMETLNKDNSYAYCKLIGALWMGSMARSKCSNNSNNDLRFVTVSPGACIGTDIFNPMPLVMKWILKIAFQVMYFRGSVHDVEAGAKRYIDALTDKTGSVYKNGYFYASQGDLTGPAVEQNEIYDVFNNETYQDNAAAAIDKFLEQR